MAHGCRLSGEALPRDVVAGVALLPLQAHGSAVCSPFRMCMFWVSVSKGSSHIGEALVLAVSQELKGTPNYTCAFHISALSYSYPLTYLKQVRWPSQRSRDRRCTLPFMGGVWELCDKGVETERGEELELIVPSPRVVA